MKICRKSEKSLVLTNFTNSFWISSEAVYSCHVIHCMCFRKCLQRESSFSVHIYISWACMTSLLLKRSNTANLIRVKRKGEGGRDERKDSSASVFEVANANGLNDLTAGGKWIPLCSYLQTGKEKYFFYWTLPFGLPVSQTFNETTTAQFWKLMMMFSTHSECEVVCFSGDLTCLLLWKDCQEAARRLPAVCDVLHCKSWEREEL